MLNVPHSSRLSSHFIKFGLFILVLFSMTGRADSQGKPSWVSNELLVGFRPGISDRQAENLYRAHGAQKIEDLAKINVHRIRVPAQALEAVENALSRRPEVKFVERNYRLSPDFIPSDPLYPSQWHLPKVSADLAWEISQGAPSVVVAILDSGVDPTHPDLATKLVAGYNFYNNNTNTSDVYGHGTKVAGTAAAICNNAAGVASPACQNRIMPIRVTDTTGAGYVSAIANGLTWAVDHGAKVMNLSFAGVAGISTITNAAQYVVNHGGVVVAAAGNCGCFDSTPQNPYMISVSATDSSDSLASFSSQGNYVDVAAPGVGIYTTTSGGGYGAPSGTSFSSPLTAGVVALIMSVNPGLKPAEVESLLEANADNLGLPGYDTAYGHGRINAYRAVAAAATNSPPPDTTAPVAKIDSPANGATVSGGVSVGVSASDNVGVTRVDLYVDGGLYASDTAAPYSFYWDTTRVGDGAHTLAAVAHDAANNAGTSANVSVSVNNAPVVSDTQPPVVTMNAPTSAAKGNKLTVTVTATDNVGVVKVELYVDGALVGTDSSVPYSFTINTGKFAAGQHTLQAKAYDPSGNVGVSSPATFTK